MEHENDIFWHALNYRTAATPQAEEMWQELNACVKRLIAEERDTCAKVCDGLAERDYCVDVREAAAAIRKRSNV